MISATPGAGDRRRLLLGASIIGGLVVLFRGVPAWRSWRTEVRLNAAEVMAQAARTDALLGSFPAALDTLQARTAQLVVLGPAFLTDETTTGTASNLVAFLGDLGRQAPVRIDAVQVRVDSSQSHPLPRIAVDLQVTADIAGLTSFLSGVEQGPTLLAVRRLVVRAQNADAPKEQAEQLAVQLTIEALALTQPPGRAQ